MIKEKIINHLKSIIKNLTSQEVSITLEIPSDLSHGDYTTNIAFQVSKGLKKAPMEIAQKIAQQFTVHSSQFTEIEKVEAVKPGFVNFWIAKKELGRNMKLLLSSEERVAVSGKLKNKRILVEYAHPNTHKEMHIGHMRTLITGEALSRLFESQGATVFRANYQGDIGPHVAKALYGINKIMEERNLRLDTLQTWSNYDKAYFLGEGYVRGNTDYEIAKNQIDEINGLLYQSVDKNTPTMSLLIPASSLSYDVVKLYKQTRQWSLDYYDEFYQRFMTTFNRLFFESEMVECGIKIVKENIGKIFTDDNGAIIFSGEKYGLHTRVFITQAGYPTYEGKEMCNAFTEYEIFPFDLKMHIVASEQSGYFQVIFKALELLDPEKFKDKQYHLPMGMVQLLDRKMSSRTGDILTVDWLIDQVKDAVKELFKEGKIVAEEKDKLLEQIAIGAVKYSVLKVGTKQDVAFDIQKSVTLEGNSGPYLQYTYARTQSILRKAETTIVVPTEERVRHHRLGEASPLVGEGSTATELKKTSDNDVLLYNKEQYESEEYCLLRQMYQFPEFVQQAAENYSPHVLCEYLFVLAQQFNLFYQKHRILDASEEQDRHFRLKLTQAVGHVLQEGLGLLGIAAPEKM